jgi:hypothetical protein
MEAAVTTFGAYAMDNFIGTDMSKLTEVSIPDLTPNENLIAHYILNSLSRGFFTAEVRAEVYYFLRRVTAALEEWRLAREATLSYVETPGQHPMRYVKAIGHWEAVLTYTWQSCRLVNREKNGWYTKGDGSVAEAANELYNQVKHIDDRIAGGETMPVLGPLGVWLTNDGLRSTKHFVTFVGLGELLVHLADLADKLEDPAALSSGSGSRAE